jgi:hypothetical protein
LQLRTDGAGIGEWLADLKTEMGCGIVQRGNLQRVVLPCNDDAGRIILFWRVFFTRIGTHPGACPGHAFAQKRLSRRGAAARELAFDAVGGQARQPQAEDTPPVS